MTNVTHNFFLCIYLYFNSLLISSTSCSSSGETNFVNTAFGSCHSVSVAVSCAGRKWTSDLHTTWPPTATRGCIDTVCLSWWWSRCARNMYIIKNINKYIENTVCHVGHLPRTYPSGRYVKATNSVRRDVYTFRKHNTIFQQIVY